MSILKTLPVASISRRFLNDFIFEKCSSYFKMQWMCVCVSFDSIFVFIESNNPNKRCIWLAYRDMVEWLNGTHTYTLCSFVRSFDKNIRFIWNYCLQRLSLPLSDSPTWTHKVTSKQAAEQTMTWNHFEKLHLQSANRIVRIHTHKTKLSNYLQMSSMK